MSINGGYGSSSSGNSVTAGGGYSQGKVDRAWVNNQSGLVATDQANIKADSIELKGALLGSLADNQTNIETNNPIVYENINNYDNSEQKGASAQLSIGSQFTKAGQPTDSGKVGQKTLTLSMQNQSSESKQTSYATIGTGSIKVNGVEQTPEQLAGLNRDMSNTTSATTSQITHALNAKIDLDLRFFTKAGRDSIADDFNNFLPNLTHSVGGIAAWTTFATYKVGQGLVGAIGGDSQSLNGILRGAQQGSAISKLNDPNADDRTKLALQDVLNNNNLNLGWTSKSYGMLGNMLGDSGSISFYTEGKSFTDGTDMYLNPTAGSANTLFAFLHEDAHINVITSEDAANYTASIGMMFQDIYNFVGGNSFSTDTGISQFTNPSNPASAINMKVLTSGNDAARPIENRQEFAKELTMVATNGALLLSGNGNRQTEGTSRTNSSFGVAGSTLGGLFGTNHEAVKNINNDVKDSVAMTNPERYQDVANKAYDTTLANYGAMGESSGQNLANILSWGMPTYSGEVSGIYARAQYDPEGAAANAGLYAAGSKLIASGFNFYRGEVDTGLLNFGSGLLDVSAILSMGIEAPLTTAARTARIEDVVATGNVFAKENPVLFNYMLNPPDTVPYLTKGSFGLPVGEVVQLNKAAYYTGLNELAAGNEVRVIGPYRDYLYLSEALGTKAYYVDPSIWNNMPKLQSTTGNFTFIERGSNNNATFILANPDLPASKYGVGLTNETNWLKDFFGYTKSADGTKYTK